VEEALSSASDQAFAPQAMEVVKKTNFGGSSQRQIYVNVRFVPLSK